MLGTPGPCCPQTRLEGFQCRLGLSGSHQDGSSDAQQQRGLWRYPPEAAGLGQAVVCLGQRGDALSAQEQAGCHPGLGLEGVGETPDVAELVD